ncbi:hypothetical protein [Myxococcus sp. AS-1-15]|uniref:hypothetical protein n=1 Tax=Myxococcus sp. AS-1-15 TaxID=2874600 RepID=UPI001CBD0C5D|nr:hypothetical protein [Myxococcus sp. AS-1-15]MBZ4400403.1 hypothetical protein [Myxococcus sp. AS-1-15]
MSTDVLFFGAKRGMGHCLWTPGFGFGERLVPALLHPRHIDAKLAPKDPHQVEGRARLHHVYGWTVLAWWDRSSDRRMNSNSAILVRGTHDFAAVVAAAREHFPELAPRFAALVEVPT